MGEGKVDLLIKFFVEPEGGVDIDVIGPDLSDDIFRDGCKYGSIVVVVGGVKHQSN